MANKLEFESTDWTEVVEHDKEKIIEDIASDFARKNSELIGKAISDEEAEIIKARIRQSVMSRKDLTPEEKEEAVDIILGQVTGYGALHELFAPGQKVALVDEAGGRMIVDAKDITEVFINPSKDGPKVFCSYRGRSWKTEKEYFKDDEEVLRYCQRICEGTGRPLTEDASIVDAWLADGTRLAAVGFKTSPLGTVATLRKSPLTRPPMPMSQLVKFKMLPEFAANLISDLLVKGRANVGIFGRTDSGKTTFMRAMANDIDPIDRVFIGETSFEMFLPHLPNCVNLVEVVYGDKTIVDMSQICRTMNRNNPDRAILGEIRGKEIVAASQMASSTSGGFWATGHAGTIRDLRTRMFGMFLEAGIQLPMDFLDEIIASMFDFVIFLDKETKTERRLRTLMEIVQITEEGYRTIIKFDYDKFLASDGEVRQWVYEDTITSDMLGKLAFNGGNVKPEYKTITNNKYLM